LFGLGFESRVFGGVDSGGFGPLFDLLEEELFLPVDVADVAVDLALVGADGGAGFLLGGAGLFSGGWLFGEERHFDKLVFALELFCCAVCR